MRARPGRALALCALSALCACVQLAGPCRLELDAHRLACDQGGSAVLLAPRQTLEAAGSLLPPCRAARGP